MKPTHTSLFPLCAGLAGFLLAGGSAAGQATSAPATPTSENAPIELSVFEVSGSRDIGYQSSNAAEVTRMNTAIADIPMNVTILNQEFIEDTLARSTEDVLEYVPGFVPTSNNDDWVVRGFSNGNTKFLNGFPQQDSIGKVSIANIERVEVLKGPAAVLYGQGGFSTTVNRVTKRPKAQPGTTVRASYGPLESMRFDLDNTGPIGGAKSPFRYRINAVWDDGEYYRGISHDEKTIAPAVSWQISPTTRLSLEYVRVEETDGGGVWRQPMFRGDPRGFLMANGTYLSYGDNKQAYAAPGDIREWKRGFGMADFQHAFSRNVQMRVQFAMDTKDQYYNEHQPEQGSLTILQDAVLMPRRWRIRTQEYDNLRSRNELLAQFRTGPASHRALLGFGWDRSDGEIWNRDGIWNRGGLAASSANLNSRWPAGNVGSRFNQYPNVTLAEFLADPRRAGFNPNMVLPVNVLAPAASRAVPAESDRPPLPAGNRNYDFTRNTEYYLADVVSFAEERFFLTGGLRHTQTDDRRVNGHTGALVRDNNADSTTFSAGIVYHLNREKKLTLYANANSSFIPEFRRQPDGTALDPEEGNQKELGFRYSLMGDRIQGLVAVYEILQQNVSRPDPNRTDDDWFIQTDGIRSRGFEFNLNARVTDAWSVMGGYAYNDSREEGTGVRTMYAPYHMFTAFNKYSFRDGALRGLDVSVGSIFIGDRPTDPTSITSLGGLANAPLWTMPAEWRFDLVLRYRLPFKGRIRWDVGGKIQNAFDNQEIYKLADAVSVQRQPGRTLQASVTARF